MSNGSHEEGKNVNLAGRGRKPNFHVITGGPGAGKSTLIEELRKKDLRCVESDGHSSIQNLIGRQAYEGTDNFVRQMLNADISFVYQGELELKENRMIFFDRGIPDIIGYLHIFGIQPPLLFEEAAIRYRYNNRVFILPPCKKIYALSKQAYSWVGAVSTYEMMWFAYEKYGYYVEEIPLGSVEDRVQFILQEIRNSA